jgi:hypothetical protein
MLTSDLCKKLQLTEKQLLLLRATAKGLPAGDEELYEEKVEQVMKICDLSFVQAEKRLIANVNYELDQQNSHRQAHWQQKIATGKAIVQHDTTGIEAE